MSEIAAEATVPTLPPRSTTGTIGWLRQNLFSSWTNTLLTVAGLWLAYELVNAIVHWALLNATWTGQDGSACTRPGAGACWPFITNKFSQFMYGRYPAELRWR